MKPGATELTIATLLAFAGSGHAAQFSCHIHAPADAAATPATPSTIGPFDGRQVCEQARRLMFGEDGRCHCTFGFSTFPGRGGNDATPPPAVPDDPTRLP